jgi:hypothetical protein
MNEYFTWELLASYTGAILAVALITQFIKNLGFIKKIPTRVTSYVVALIIMILALIFTGNFTWGGAVLTIINAVVVSLASNGTRDALALERKKETENIKLNE